MLWRRATGFAGVGLTLLSVTGCYTYAPPVSAPTPGAEVSVILTDQGRIALNERVGPAIDQLRGRLVVTDGSSVTISMRESVTLRGESAPWTDEQLTLTREQFGAMRIRTLSKGRSGAVAGTFGAFAAFLVINGGLDIGGRKLETDPSTPPGGPGNNTKIGSLFIPFRSDF